MSTPQPLEVDNDAAATARIDELKARFPEVKSAYQPSGAMAAGAWGALFRGGGKGLLTALAIALVVLTLSVLLIALGDWMLSWRYNLRILFLVAAALRYGGPFFCGLIGFGVFALLLGAVEEAAKHGGCRSNGNARAVAVAATLVGSVVFATIVWQLPVWWPSLGASSPLFSSTWGIGIGSALGVLFAVWLTATIDLAGVTKFCEPCQQAMTKTDLPPFDIEQLDRIRDMLEGRASREPLPTSEAALRVQPTLHRCATCHGGFVEGDLKVNLFYKKIDGATETRAASWRCVSLAIGADTVSWLRDQATPTVRLDTTGTSA